MWTSQGNAKLDYPNTYVNERNRELLLFSAMTSAGSVDVCLCGNYL